MFAPIGCATVSACAARRSACLAEEFAEPQWAAGADTVISLVAAMRGDEDNASAPALARPPLSESTSVGLLSRRQDRDRFAPIAATRSTARA
jgi:hypothetical protein